MMHMQHALTQRLSNMPNPEKDGWYMATYGDYVSEALFTKGKWWVFGDYYVNGNMMLIERKNPDTWKTINEWQDEGK